ncbi:sigma 54-interacting transcriptional regulator [Vagococcus carniphilus]|uniref:sigma 54-interacting transcriptional regulator n=1 Tax=Vagococcus carniphilus TaxID=218144 RepID=UPI00288E8C17|nr:sigma 54-interacting transcriptional regulator [Vagococcus carniphilus]MDT2849646.1 sigma 54-interacting transcriptional regulator [Vagococcus carniphilus]
MKRETHDLIIKILENEKNGLTTLEIADALALSRSATSLYLNKLLEKKEVTQKGTRPVYWQTSTSSHLTNQEDVFQQYIGFDGSAHEAIEKCKAAILYPPVGLPLLLCGPSGVGKSFLAKLIFDYLKEQKKEEAKTFIIFNCADYANNPELLSSILFGHTKGAFTGAESEKKGLLKQADGGVLFLDEVHRLSKENQEKLFQFMDSGQFRPMGEESKIVSSQVRLLFATTEDPKEVLLPTFYRRLSVVVNLPALHDRPILERISLVNHLFVRESIRLKRDLKIDNRIFKQLLDQQIPGNVGSLINEIQMYCADALRKNSDHDILEISEDDAILFTNVSYTQNITENKIDYLGQLNETFTSLISSNSSILELKEELFQFDSHFLEGNFHVSSDFLGNQLIKQIEDNNKQIIDNKAITQAPIKCALRLLQVNKNTLSIKTLEELKRKVSKEYPRTALFSHYVTNNLSPEIKLFVEVILSVLLVEKISEEIRYHALLVAHGNTTASSIQAVANKLCGEYVFDAINMPLTSSIRDVVAQVKLWLSERDTSEGVIMLVDMGSLTHLYKSLKPQILGELLVINNLTTSYALEIGQQLVNGQMFYDVAKNAEKTFKTNIQYFEGFSVEKNIIIASISGYDISKKLKEICEKNVNPDIKLIVLNFNELRNILDRASTDQNYLKETSLILTTSYLDNKTDVPSINLLDVLDEDAEKQLNTSFKNLIHPNNIPNILNEFIHFFSKEGLSEKLEFLNPDVIIRQVETITEKCEKRFNLQLSAKMKFNLTMHLALMVERMMLGDTDYPVPENLLDLKLNQKFFYQNMKDIVYTLEQFYRIQISDWELFVLFEILNA